LGPQCLEGVPPGRGLAADARCRRLDGGYVRVRSAQALEAARERTLNHFAFGPALDTNGTSQTVVSPDGSKKNTITGVTSGAGTGKYRGIQWESTMFDPEKNLNETRGAEAEYSIVK
jgi:hypothetical protein